MINNKTILKAINLLENTRHKMENGELDHTIKISFELIEIETMLRNNLNKENLDLIGTIFTESVNLNIRILEIEEPIPPEYIIDFKEWILNKGIELGLGTFYEYFSINMNSNEDIPVRFKVYRT